MISCQRELEKLKFDPESLPRPFSNTIITSPDFEMGEDCCRCRRITAWPGATIKSLALRTKRIVCWLRPSKSPSPSPPPPPPLPESASSKPPSSRRPPPKRLSSKWSLAKWTLRKRPSEPNSECPLLQLPVDILVCVIEYLPEVDRHILSVTCRAFWNTERLTLRHEPISFLSQNEYLCYLTQLSRNNPDVWVCEECNKLHPAGEPKSKVWQTCVKHFVRGGRLAGDFQKLSLSHQDVQRALKLERLGNLDKRQRDVLDQLMKPNRARISTDSEIMGAIRSDFAAYPKIVEGRYLVLSVWTYQQRQESVSLQSMGKLTVCYHQRSDSILGSLICSALESASQRPRTTVDGFCPDCPVDFSVNFSPKRTTVRAWHDLGPEGTPLDVAWRVHCWPRLRSSSRDLTLGHVGGSVRELYES